MHTSLETRGKKWVRSLLQDITAVPQVKPDLGRCRYPTCNASGADASIKEKKKQLPFPHPLSSHLRLFSILLQAGKKRRNQTRQIFRMIMGKKETKCYTVFGVQQIWMHACMCMHWQRNAQSQNKAKIIKCAQ